MDNLPIPLLTLLNKFSLDWLSSLQEFKFDASAKDSSSPIFNLVEKLVDNSLIEFDSDFFLRASVHLVILDEYGVTY